MLHYMIIITYIIAGLSIGTWPVTGTYTGITYSNMYCAICNGAVQPVTKDEPLEYFDRHKALEFWTMKIYCNNKTIDLVQNEKKSIRPGLLSKLLQDRLE